MSLRADLVKLDVLVGGLGPDEADALRAACEQIGAALTSLGKAVPDGTASPIAEAIEGVLFSSALSYRPGKGWTGLKPKMLAALEDCPALRKVAAQFITRLQAAGS